MVLVALIGLSLFLLYQAWQTDYPNKPPQLQASSINTTLDANGVPVSAAAAGATDIAPGSAGPSQQRVQVQTDRMVVDIALAGGEVRRVELSRDAIADKKHPEQKLDLLDDRDGQIFTFQSGLAGTENPLTSGQSSFTSPKAEYKLADGAATLEVPL